MKIADCMTPDCRYCDTSDNLVTLAKRMADEDIGAIPVGSGDKLVGMVTDRDIVVRGLANGKDPASVTASEVMADPVLYCYDDQDCSEVAATMAEQQVRRLPVVDRDKRLRGFVSVGDFARAGATGETARAEQGIAAG